MLSYTSNCVSTVTVWIKLVKLAKLIVDCYLDFIMSTSINSCDVIIAADTFKYKYKNTRVNIEKKNTYYIPYAKSNKILYTIKCLDSYKVS